MNQILRQWLSTFLTPFNTVLPVVGTPNHKIICCFITVILLLLWIVMQISDLLGIWYVRPPLRGQDPQVEKHCLMALKWTRNWNNGCLQGTTVLSRVLYRESLWEVGLCIRFWPFSEVIVTIPNTENQGEEIFTHQAKSSEMQKEVESYLECSQGRNYLPISRTLRKTIFEIAYYCPLR